MIAAAVECALAHRNKMTVLELTLAVAEPGGRGSQLNDKEESP
jgi:hypothetical protein